jgi:DNA-binding winged helix-turn-helix (wHTH) protein
MEAVFTFGPFRFDPADGLRRGAEEVPLPPRALAVLTALVSRAGTVVSKQTLLDAAWPDSFVTEASLLEAVRLLREALGDDRHQPTYIQTVHRRGYRFVAAVSLGEATISSLAEAKASWLAEAEASALRTAEIDTKTYGAPGLQAWLQPMGALSWGPEWRPLLVAALSAVVSMVGVAMVFALFGQRVPEPRPTMRFTIALPADSAIDPLRGSLAVSSDGTRLVYAAIHGGRPRLSLRTVDRDSPTLIEGSDEASDPFFSPDGEWIGFFAHGSLKKLRLEGGRAVVLCAARSGAGASWGADGTIVFGGGPSGGLARVSAQGGEPVVLATPRSGSREVRYGWPELLPDGTGVIYTVVTLADRAVALLDFSTGVRTTLVQAAAFGRLSPTGHLVFERRGRLEAAPFSLAERRVTAEPQPVLRGVGTGSALNGPQFAFSRTGSLVYVPGRSASADDRLHWLGVDGRIEPAPFHAAPLGSLDIAPDLEQLALTLEGDEGPNVWLGDLSRGALSRLTTEGVSVNPTWRPDGLEIAFAFSKAGPFNIFVRPIDGDHTVQPLLASPWNQFPTSWSPDSRLAYTELHPLTGADVWLFDVDTRTRHPIVRTLFDESHARFSPDGRWLAYMSNESGRWEVFVRPASATGTRVQVSTAGGGWPCWSIDGRTLYFSAGGRTAAAAVQDAPALAVSTPVMMSGADLEPAGGFAAPNRVLVREDGSLPARHELRVVVEWFAELRRLVRVVA